MSSGFLTFQIFISNDVLSPDVLTNDNNNNSTVPIVESQKIGWTAPVELRDCVAHDAHPKKSCAETIYQDELVKSGFAPR